MDRKEFDKTTEKFKKILKGKKDFVILFAATDNKSYHQTIQASILDKHYAIGMIERMKSILIEDLELESETEDKGD